VILWSSAAVIVVLAMVLLLGLQFLQASMARTLVGAAPWSGNYTDVGALLLWTLGDTTEPGYAHAAFAGVLMLLGGYAAHRGHAHESRWAGFPVTSGTGLFPWALGSAALGLVFSNLAWGWTIAASGIWQPTFVPFASVPAAVVLLYGGSTPVLLTGAALGAGLTTPIALAVVNLCCRPLGLPNVIGATTGMWVSAVIAFALCRHLPWIPVRLVAVPRCHARSPHTFRDTAPQGPKWLARRIMADFAEAQFIGNEWAGAALLLGIMLSFLLSPALASGAGELLPRLLGAQIMTSALSVTLWHRQWAKYGWYPSFVPVVSIAPATVIMCGGSLQSIVVGAVLGALVGPPVAAAIARRLPADFHPFIGNVAAMASGTALVATVLTVGRCLI
jgi:hypothetical protein